MAQWTWPDLITGLINGRDRYEIVSGLEVGDEVITSAPSNLKNGLPVKTRK